MTSIEFFNFPAFDKATKHLSEYYDVVFNPADHDRQLLKKKKDWMPTEADQQGGWKQWAMKDAPSLRDMLGADLAWIAKEATDIYMLRGWERSSGAKAEHALAVALGINIHYQ